MTQLQINDNLLQDDSLTHRLHSDQNTYTIHMSKYPNLFNATHDKFRTLSESMFNVKYDTQNNCFTPKTYSPIKTYIKYKSYANLDYTKSKKHLFLAKQNLTELDIKKLWSFSELNKEERLTSKSSHETHPLVKTSNFSQSEVEYLHNSDSKSTSSSQKNGLKKSELKKLWLLNKNKILDDNINQKNYELDDESVHLIPLSQMPPSVLLSSYNQEHQMTHNDLIKNPFDTMRPIERCCNSIDKEEDHNILNNQINNSHQNKQITQTTHKSINSVIFYSLLPILFLLLTPFIVILGLLFFTCLPIILMAPLYFCSDTLSTIFNEGFVCISTILLKCKNYFSNYFKIKTTDVELYIHENISTNKNRLFGILLCLLSPCFCFFAIPFFIGIFLLTLMILPILMSLPLLLLLSIPLLSCVAGICVFLFLIDLPWKSIIHSTKTLFNAN